MKLKHKIITLCSTAVLVVSTALGVGFSISNANAEEWSTSVASWEWKDEYQYASVFKVPAYKVTESDVTVDATSIVTYPDGRTSTETTVILDKEGRYTVTYYASVGGKEFSKSESFVVNYAPYYISNANSSVVQGTYTGFGADDPANEKYANDGLIVRLAKGDRLQFTKVLDVSEITAQESLVEGFVTPDAYRVADCERIMITLTDAVDPSIYFDVEINRWWMTSANTGKATSFVMAGGNGQDMVGYEEGKGLHVNDGVGTGISHTFEAVGYLRNGNPTFEWGSGLQMTPVAPSKGPFKIAYDSAEKKVYANSSLVSDLDSVDYYDDLWSGFPSGKARLSVWANDYLSATANFCLTKVMAMPDLFSSTFEDKDPPKITIDTEYEEMPEAQLNKPYTIPTATAYDDYSGVVSVKTAVWYNYESSQPVSVSVIGGKFTPTRSGYYSIVYTATDSMGNTAESILPVHAGSPIAPLKVFCPENAPTTATLGQEVPVAQPKIEGGAGKKVCVVTVKGPEHEEAEAIVEGFTPDVSGKWTVTYTVTDYLGSVATASFEVTATPGAVPFIYDTPMLPKVLMNNVEYVLPKVSAFDYSTGRKEEKPCDVKVKIGDNETLMKAGDTFVPSVTENGEKYAFTYFSGSVVLETVEVPCVIIRETQGTKDLVKVQNYFYGENFLITTEDENGDRYNKGIKVKATTNGDVDWTFANAQLADTVSVKLSSLKGLIAYKGFSYTLTDTQNPEEQLTVDLEAKTGSATLSCGDFSTNLDLNLAEETVFEFKYANERVYLQNVSFIVSAYDNGEPFHGFSSGKVYITVTMENAREGAGYLILDITGTPLSYREIDTTAPNFAVLGDYGGSFSIGKTYTMAPAMAGDTFAAKTSLTVTVTDPEDNVVVDKDGLELKDVSADRAYSFDLVKYGKYKMEYTAKEEDWFNGRKVFINYVMVMDEIAPAIRLTSDYTKTVKVGENIIIPNFEVSDNLDATENLSVDKLILNPLGRTERLPGSSNSLKASHEGMYRITIMVKDVYGNMTTVYLGVEVTK